MNCRAADIVLVVFISAGLAACVHPPRHIGPLRDPHPAHYYDYHYYPDVSVYFHLNSGHYFFRDARGWSRARVLPSHIYLDHRARKTIVIRGERPYAGVHEHRKKYPPRRSYKRQRKHVPREREYNRHRHEEYRRRRR